MAIVLGDYPSNSHKSRERAAAEKVQRGKDEHLQKVTTGSIKKREGGSSFGDVFKQDLHTVKDYIINDVLIPSLKKAVSEAVSNGVDTFLYHGEAKRRKGSRGTPASHVSYRSYYDDRDDRYDRAYERSRRSYYDELIFDNRGDAERVLDGLEAALDKYEIVTIGDLYDLAGENPVHTDYKYGWRTLRNAGVIRCRDGGYSLDMPRPMPID